MVVGKFCVCAKIYNFAGGVQKTEFGKEVHSEPINVGKLYKAATICLWTAYQCAQARCMSSMNAGSSLRLLVASTMT